MRFRTRIKERAKERGTTVAELARQLHLYRSNLSAMDAGRRIVSLQLLTRIATFLDCSPADLIEALPASDRPVFRSTKDLQRLREKEEAVPDGLERGWVHRTLLAWQRHYRVAREQNEKKDI